jgi:FAD/FMN-containing dehydrogenase
MFESELLDLDTWTAVKKSAPKVTGVSWGHACEVVKSMQMVAGDESSAYDGNGQVYWQTTLKHLALEIEGLDLKGIGRACRELGLTLWRKSDGYHVAWSLQQMAVLIKYFKL